MPTGQIAHLRAEINKTVSREERVTILSILGCYEIGREQRAGRLHKERIAKVPTTQAGRLLLDAIRRFDQMTINGSRREIDKAGTTLIKMWRTLKAEYRSEIHKTTKPTKPPWED
jgi:hypothetical protein